MTPLDRLRHLGALHADLSKGKKRKGQPGYVETTDRRGRKTWKKAPTPDLHTQREDALVDWERNRSPETEARLAALGLHPVVPAGTTTKMDARLHVVPEDAPREHSAFPGDDVAVVHGGWQTIEGTTYRRAEVRAVPRPPPEPTPAAPVRPSDAILGVLRKRRSLRLADLRRALPDVPKHALNAALLSLHRQGVVELHALEHTRASGGALLRSGRTTYHAVSLV